MNTLNTFHDVLLKWENDLTFRQKFQKDPKQALADAGLLLSAEELEKIHHMLRQNGKLDDRISK